ncbi:TPA: imidazole glycerol phosphate synthase subunit HisF, partial [bacterium]|nr:imidazole glycerol phosphate synthase subunit HisF [bacterium]
VFHFKQFRICEVKRAMKRAGIIIRES